jgi:hypothetical protein
MAARTLSALVDTAVATAFAVSWKPLVKSKTTARTMVAAGRTAADEAVSSQNLPRAPTTRS